MSFEPNPKQALALFTLLFSGEEPRQSELRPSLTNRERQELIDAGLITVERAPQSTRQNGVVYASRIAVTDKAWAWASAHLDAELPRSPSLLPAFRALLARIKCHVERGSFTLAELLSTPQPAAPRSVSAAPTAESLVSRIRSACLSLSGGQFNVRVRIAKLRTTLPDVAHEQLDRTLLEMQRADLLVLYPLEDPNEVRREDAAAAVRIAGAPRHIIYLRP